MCLNYQFPLSNSVNSKIIQLIKPIQNTNLSMPLVIKYVALFICHPPSLPPPLHPLAPSHFTSLAPTATPSPSHKEQTDIQEEKEKTLSLFVAALIYFVH